MERSEKDRQMETKADRESHERLREEVETLRSDKKLQVGIVSVISTALSVLATWLVHLFWTRKG